MKRKMNRILSSSVTLLLLLQCFAAPLFSYADTETVMEDFAVIPEAEEIITVEEITEVTETAEEGFTEQEEEVIIQGTSAETVEIPEDSWADDADLPQPKEVAGVEEVIETGVPDEEAIEEYEEDEVYVDEETGLMLGSFVAPVVKKQRMLLGAKSNGSTYYDRREDLGPVKNQGSDNICWAYATVGLAESSMGITNGSYSENGLAYFMYNSPSAKDPLGLITGDGNEIQNGKEWNTLGGNPTFAMMMLSGFEGVQSNSTISGSDPYDASKAFTNAAVLSQARIYNIKKNPELVKAAIKNENTKNEKFGAVTMEYNAGSETADYKKVVYKAPGSTATSSTYVRQFSDGATATHSVMIVGWDDNFNKEYFTAADGSKPQNNGAWLVRNSWGQNAYGASDGGGDGYFWISYEDKSIGTNALAMSFVDAGTYKYNYHYDGSAGYSTNIFANGKKKDGKNLYTGTLSSGGSVGNIFKATGETQEVKAVSVGFASANIGYSVQIYRSASPMEDPTDGTPVGNATKGTTDAAGIYTIKLSAPAYIPKNYYFSVVVTTTGTAGQAIQLYTDQNVQYTNKAGEDAYLYCKNATAADQSFVKTTSSSRWADLYYSAMSTYNEDGSKITGRKSLSGWTIRIKALTDLCDEQPVALTKITAESVTAGVGMETALKYTLTPEDASLNGGIRFASSDESVAKVSSDGKVTGVKAGTATITISGTDKSGNVRTASVEVKVKQYPTSIAFSTEEKQIRKGGSLQLSLTVLPRGAETSGLTFIWSSDDTDVCKIKSSSGTTARISAVDEGWCDISVQCKEYPALKAYLYVDVIASGSTTGGGGGGGGGGGVILNGAKGPGSAGQTGTFSSYWYQEGNGDWKIKDKTGKVISTAWLCDDAVTANGQNVWYLLDQNGSMLTGGLVQDNTGNYYSLEMEHNGYYGMLRYKNGTYDGIYMEFSQNHDGTFGKILNQAAIDALKAKYGVTTYGVGNENCTYTSKF